MRLVNCAQRSPEWIAARLGRLTSSCAADMLTTLKDAKKEAAGRRNLRIRLALERVTGRSQEREYISPAMQDGIDREAAALGAYESLTAAFVTRVGFVAHTSLMAGCSPDGFTVDGGLVEAKSPMAATHWEYLKTGVIPGEYQKQIVHQLWITGAPWCDWLSFHPEFPESLRVKLVRVLRVQAEIDSYELMARQFLREVDRDVDEIEARASGLRPVA